MKLTLRIVDEPSIAKGQSRRGHILFEHARQAADVIVSRALIRYRLSMQVKMWREDS